MKTATTESPFVGNRYAAQTEIDADVVVPAQVLGEGVLRVFPANFYDQEIAGSIPGTEAPVVNLVDPIDQKVSA